MRVEEIERILEINGNEVSIYLPNETFSDLQKYVTGTAELAYSYSYVYLANFLYRNCKYFNVNKIIDSNTIKEILGYSKSNRTMNHLTKKNGILDELGYFESTKDYPVAWSFEYGVKELSFLMSSELDTSEVQEIPRMFFLKKPMKAFERTLNYSTEDGETITENVIGSFYDVSNTHMIPFEVFMFFMSKKDLGVVGFYLYSWLKHRNDIFPKGYDVSMEKLSKETGIPLRTLIRYIGELKGYRAISFKHNQSYFVLGAAEDDRKANTYITNRYHSFLNESAPYDRIKKISNEKYLKIKEESKISSIDNADSRKSISEYVDNIKF